MGFVTENNRTFTEAEEGVIYTGVDGGGIPLVGRIFIDLGIAIASILATIATGGTALPGIIPGTIEGLVGSTVGLVTNTSIDVAENKTDALTLGLDIGLPFATELLGAGVSFTAQNIGLSESIATKLISNRGLGEFVDLKSLDKISINTIKNQAIDNIGTRINKITEAFNNNIQANQFNREFLEEGIRAGKSIEKITKSVQELDQSFKSFTDLLDKVTGTVRDILEKMLPRLYKTLEYLKDLLKQVKRAVGYALNPITKSFDFVETRVKAFLTKTVPDELNIKSRLMEIKARYNIEKQSILQNALIAKYNIQKVSSKWILGFSTVAEDVDEEGKITNAHLIWWFIPEATKHNGERGAVPEPYGKRPVAMLNVNQAQIDFILAAASKGKFYLDYVIGGRADTALYGSTSGVQVSDVSSNFISKLFKNAVSIIPGYALFVDIKSSISQFQKLTDGIVEGTLGTSYYKSMTTYFDGLKQHSTDFIPPAIKADLTKVYNNQQFDGANILKSASDRLTNNDYIDELGRVRHIKNQ